MRIHLFEIQTQGIPRTHAFYWLLNKKKSFFQFAFLFLVFSAPILAQKPEFDEVLVTLKVKDIGQTELSTLIDENKEVYLSVPQVFNYLKIKNNYNDNYSTIEGFFINQNNLFRIDKNTQTIQYKGKETVLEKGDLVSTTANLFLKAHYFNSIFELENTFYFRNLFIYMSSKIELPAIREARLKLMRDNIDKIKERFIADTIFTRDKPLFHFGTADWSINTTEQTNGTGYQRVRLNLGGMLAGGDFISSLNYSSNRSFLLKNQYYRWRYVNNDNKYISEISLGKIAIQSTAPPLNPVVGVRITNVPIHAKKYFGSYTLSDYTNPEWTVELYINSVLVDYKKADANGFFSFDVPLMYGRTQVSVRYFGPWGEEEVSGKQFVIPFYFLPKNKLEYSLSSGIIEDGEKNIFTNAKINYGLSNFITLEGGLEYVSSIEKNKIIPYFGTSIRLTNQLFLSGGYYSKVKYTGNLNFSSSKNVRMNLDYTKYKKGQKTVRTGYSEVRKASISTPIRTSNVSGFSRFTFQQNISPTRVTNILELLFSRRIYKMNFNFTTNSCFMNKETLFIFSNLSTSLRLPKGVVLIPNIRYEYSPLGITNLKVELKKKVFKKGFLRASMNLDLKNKMSSFQIGFQYNFKFSNMSLSNNFQKNKSTFSQSTSGSLIYEPGSDFVEFSNRKSVGRGSLKFIPFLDTNENGKRDPNEAPVIGLEILMNGGKKHLNKKEGTTIITGLEPYVEKYITLNTDNINNIAWRLKNKTLNIILNPNQLRTIEVPFSVMGEVAGMVQLNKNGELIGVSGLKVNIYKNDTVFITSVLSKSEGYFVYLGLSSGQYSARIDALQLQKLKLRTESKNTHFIIDNGKYGDIVDNLEFELYKEDAEKIPANNIIKEN